MHDTSTGYFNYQNKNYCKIELSEAAQTITFWFYATGSNTANWYPTLFSTNSGSNNSGGVYTHIDDGSYSTYPVFRANSATSTQVNNNFVQTAFLTQNYYSKSDIQGKFAISDSDKLSWQTVTIGNKSYTILTKT